MWDCIFRHSTSRPAVGWNLTYSQTHQVERNIFSYDVKTYNLQVEQSVWCYLSLALDVIRWNVYQPEKLIIYFWYGLP